MRFNSAIKFIEMCSRNMQLKHDEPIGNEQVLVLDIDYCLYQSPEMSVSEYNTMKTALMEIGEYDVLAAESILAVPKLRNELFYMYLGIEPLVFAQTFDIPDYEKYLVPDPELKALLESINIRMFCISNGSKYRSEKILKHLKLDHCFEAVICADSIDNEFICKPMPEAYNFFQQYAGVSTPSNIYYFDDFKHNVDGAKKQGWNAFHVTSNIKMLLQETLNQLNASLSENPTNINVN